MSFYSASEVYSSVSETPLYELERKAGLWLQTHAAMAAAAWELRLTSLVIGSGVIGLARRPRAWQEIMLSAVLAVACCREVHASCRILQIVFSKASWLRRALYCRRQQYLSLWEMLFQDNLIFLPLHLWRRVVSWPFRHFVYSGSWQLSVWEPSEDSWLSWIIFAVIGMPWYWCCGGEGPLGMRLCSFINAEPPCSRVHLSRAEVVDKATSTMPDGEPHVLTVRFTHSSLAPMVDPPKGQIGPQPFVKFLEDVIGGDVRFPPIRVCYYGEAWWSLDNHRLYALKLLHQSIVDNAEAERSSSMYRTCMPDLSGGAFMHRVSTWTAQGKPAWRVVSLWDPGVAEELFDKRKSLQKGSDGIGPPSVRGGTSLPDKLILRTSAPFCRECAPLEHLGWICQHR